MNGTTGASFPPRERFDRLRLCRSDNIGPRTFAGLVGRYGSAGAALEALPALIAAGRPGRPIAIAPREEIEAELEAVEQAGAGLVLLGEADYPPLLAQIHAPPPVLTLRGNRACLGRSMAAVVGARNASAAGLAFAERLSRALSRAGHVVTSGFARGVDLRAHQAALEGGTVAVFAGGLGEPPPPSDADLLERLLENGAALSEMPFFWRARGRDFPRRNRIVAGLSRVVAVVEAARRSGSLITASFAADEGREVFAVPGFPLDPRAEGTNDLLRQGATLCLGPEDLIEAMARQDAVPVAAPVAGPVPRLAEAGEAYEPLWDELEFFDDDAAPPKDRAPGRAGPAPKEPGPLRARPLANDPAAPDPAEAAPEPASAEAVYARVLDLLGAAPVLIDELIRAARAPAPAVRAALMRLDLEGRLARHGGDLVSKL